jgi:DNA invertase Pin-like site-specific DNA recombinase
MSSTELNSGADGLFQVGNLTQKMREHQRAISELAKERKIVVQELRDKFGTGKDKITYKQIASAMGTTDQSVYKILFPQKKSKTTTEE